MSVIRIWGTECIHFCLWVCPIDGGIFINKGVGLVPEQIDPVKFFTGYFQGGCAKFLKLSLIFFSVLVGLGYIHCHSSQGSHPVINCVYRCECTVACLQVRFGVLQGMFNLLHTTKIPGLFHLYRKGTDIVTRINYFFAWRKMLNVITFLQVSMIKIFRNRTGKA